MNLKLKKFQMKISPQNFIFPVAFSLIALETCTYCSLVKKILEYPYLCCSQEHLIYIAFRMSLSTRAAWEENVPRDIIIRL